MVVRRAYVGIAGEGIQLSPLGVQGLFGLGRAGIKVGIPKIQGLGAAVLDLAEDIPRLEGKILPGVAAIKG